jgi:hypothetical protein
MGSDDELVVYYQMIHFGSELMDTPVPLEGTSALSPAAPTPPPVTPVLAATPPPQPVATVFFDLASKPVATVFLDLASKSVAQVFRFGPQNQQLQFDDLSLKITVMILLV